MSVDVSPDAVIMEGGCTCRQVRYRLLGKPLIVHACHCRWCQRETGTAHALNALYEAERVVHIAGEPEIVVTPSASGKGQKIARCPSCRLRFGATTRKPDLPFGSYASALWITLIFARRTSTFTRRPSSRGLRFRPAPRRFRSSTIWTQPGRPKASSAAASCERRRSRNSTGRAFCDGPPAARPQCYTGPGRAGSAQQVSLAARGERC
jgi:hypothetical protein